MSNMIKKYHTNNDVNKRWVNHVAKIGTSLGL